MSRLRTALLIALGAATVIVEIVSWSIPSLAWRIYPSWVYVAIITSVLSWPRSLYVAVGLGFVLDLFAPAPFGIWMLMLALLVVVSQWVKTTWVKQASALAAFAAIGCGMMAATIPIWFWLILSYRSAVLSPVIQLVPWWSWPISWLGLSVLSALLIRIIPSPYERLF
ncbi:MAG: hypothetical protein HY565_04055 [Candidatus Kerfeldbacteria bacterium]|nr:hypothetical protein [Candidatus Kerfeldbacteria bacterium]